MDEKYQVFISYRREGGEVLGRMLYDRLTQMGYKVFYDVESLRSGPFNTKLFDVIDECTDVLVVLPPRALDRCSDPTDWVRAEISYAIKQKKNVIPILMRGFDFKDVELPDDLAPLAKLNGIEASMTFFPAVMEKLTKDLMDSELPESEEEKRQNSAVEDCRAETKELPKWRKNIGLIGASIVFLCPYLLRRFYVEQSFFPGWLNKMLMSFKNSSSLAFFVEYTLFFAFLYFALNNTFEFKRNYLKLYALELSDFELDIDKFVGRLTDKDETPDLVISTNEEVDGFEKAAWCARRKGLVILSYDGISPDYMLLNFHDYNGHLQPLYLSRINTMYSTVHFLREQGFEPVWQKEKSAQYKNGEWRLLLSFYGIGNRVLVMELMRGERTSVLEKTTLEAEKQTFEGEMKQVFEDFKKDLKK